MWAPISTPLSTARARITTNDFAFLLRGARIDASYHNLKVQ